jgi:hypothetical protein
MKIVPIVVLLAVLGCTPTGPEPQAERMSDVDLTCCSSGCSVDVATLLAQRTTLDGCDVRVKGHLFDMGDDGWRFGDRLPEDRMVLELERPIPVEGLRPGVPLEVEVSGRVSHGGDRILVHSINGLAGAGLVGIDGGAPP